MTHKANVANKLEVDLMVKETLYKFGSLDILVNNAGIAYQGLITDTDEIDFDKITMLIYTLACAIGFK